MSNLPAKLAPVNPATSSGRFWLRLSMLLLAVALFFLTRWYIMFQLEVKYSDTIGPYFPYAGRAVDLGHRPYQTDFRIEYPPIGWWAIYIPRTFDSRRITDPRDPNQVEPIFESYRKAFRWQMAVVDLGCLALLLLVTHERHRQWLPWAVFSYTVVTTILGHLLYDRLDLGLLLPMLIWAYCWARSMRSQRHTIAWTAAAYTALGLSISFKIVPILAVPFLLLSEWHAAGKWRRSAAALGGLALGVGLPFAIQYAASGPGVFKLFAYHSERGIQIESMYATLMLMVRSAGLPVFVEHSHGAFEVSGPLAKDMKILSTLWLMGFLLAMGGWAVWSGSLFRRQDAYRASCFVICASVILANVLSPQYFLWALPLVILLGLEILPRWWPARWILLVLLATVAALTTWIFPYHYFRTPTNPLGLVPPQGVRSGDFPALTANILILRNLIYFAMIVWLGILFFRRRDADAAA